MVLVLATAAIIIIKRDISSLVKTYAAQSLLLAIMAVLLFFETGSVTLLLLASILVVSKAINNSVLHPTYSEKIKHKERC